MKKLALCTALPEKDLEIIKQTCEVTVCGELKHGKGNRRHGKRRMYGR